MNAVNAIDKFNAAKRVRQTLRKNPHDIEALLELAYLLGILKEPDLEQKRKVLHQVLVLEPANPKAREMLLEMDRAAMGSFHVQAMTPIVPEEQPQMPAPLDAASETRLVLRYSVVHQVIVFALMAIALGFCIAALQDPQALLFFGVCFLLLSIPLWFVSAVLQVSSLGIHLSRLFGVFRQEMEWTEIQRIEPGPMGVGMKLTAADGRSLMISSQLHEYSSLVEILQNARPDLFEVTAGRVFQKSFLAKYGLFFFLVPFTPLALGGIFVPPFLPGLLITVVIFFLWRYALQAVYWIRMDQDRLSIRSFKNSQEFSVQQIRNIDIVTVYNRHGVARSLVEIEFKDESKLTLSGFPEGNEILYGILKNWWHKNT